MEPEVIEKAKETAFRAAREAGRILKENFGKQYWVKDKPLQETLTELDVKAEEAIISIIREAFPGHAILAEESGHRESPGDYLWVIDPLDGTTNYSINNPMFCTSISLAFRGEVVLAVTSAPMSGELFHAIKGGGAFLNGKPIRVSKEGRLSNLLLAYCNGKSQEDKVEIGRIFSRIKPVARDFDRYKAGALELAFVAAGRLGSYMANSQMSWDSAAGFLLVSEAGGRVTDFSGKPWSIRSRDILASNGLIHEQLLEILREIRKENR
jgi:myo-inositol-1(or 4)-monophosphatase